MFYTNNKLYTHGNTVFNEIEWCMKNTNSKLKYNYWDEWNCVVNELYKSYKLVSEWLSLTAFLQTADIGVHVVLIIQMDFFFNTLHGIYQTGTIKALDNDYMFFVGVMNTQYMTRITQMVSTLLWLFILFQVNFIHILKGCFNGTGVLLVG